MGDFTIYHNPRCSKCRQTLTLLREHGIEPQIIEYLEHPPSAAEIEQLITRVGGDAHAVVRRKEAAYQQAGLAESSSVGEVAAAIAEHPSLLQRPIVVRGRRAVIGRPPEQVLSLLE